MNRYKEDWRPDLFKYRRQLNRDLIIACVTMAVIVACVIILSICQTAKEKNADHQSTIRVEMVGN